MSNPFVFHEFITSDVTALQSYLQKLFTWKMKTIEDNRQIIVENILPGVAPAGLITYADERNNVVPGPLFYIEVDDIDSKLQRLGTLGGKVIVAKSPINLNDYQYETAICCDTVGHQFGLMEPLIQDGKKARFAPSQFAFNEIAAQKPDELVESFYTQLFDWNANFTEAEGSSFYEISSHVDLISQAAIGKICNSPCTKQFTSFYVQVPSVSETLDKSVALGGSEIMPITNIVLDDIPYEIAMFLDPQHENRIGLIGPAIMETTDYLDG